MTDGYLICDDLDLKNVSPIRKEQLDKVNMNIDTGIICWAHSTGSIHTLLRYGIYITNNAKKMHGETTKRKVAGRKGVRKRNEY